MEVARSSFYASSRADLADDETLVTQIQAVQDEHPFYGYRRITAELRARGAGANHKRVARLMRLHGMQVRPRAAMSRRPTATTTVRSFLTWRKTWS